MLRIATLPDIHTPYQINLLPILNFLSDWGVHIIQFLGDTSNAESCNHWKEQKGYKKDVETVKEDFNILEDQVIKPFWKVGGRSTKIVYHLGNHEDWFYQAMLRDERLKGKLGVEDNIDLRKYKMSLVPLNNVINFGHLHYIHGIYAGKYHAAQMCNYYRKCIIYGHTHDIQEHMIHSPIDQKEKLFAKSIGCLCNKNPDFLKMKPNKWVNSFHIAYVRPDGTFNEYTIVITDGKFTAPNGKVYK